MDSSAISVSGLRKAYRDKTPLMKENVDMHAPQTATPLPSPALDEATLVFLRGADRVVLRVDPTLTELWEATFEGPQPTVRQTGSVIQIEYQWRLNPLEWGRQAADVRLSPTVAWRIVSHGGLARLHGDLLGLQLAGLDIEGGASHVDLRVDQAMGQVPIRVAGGASHLTVVRRGGLAASLSIGGGASQLTLDRQHFGAIGGRVRLETPDYERTANRLDVRIEGGASQVAVTAA
jgi:hypothetical protein